MPALRNRALLRGSITTGVLALVVFLGLRWQHSTRQATPTGPSPGPAAAAASATPAPLALPARPAETPAGKLREIEDSLRTASNRGAARQQLNELRRVLEGMPTNAAVAIIRQFLDSKADAPTGLGFKLARNGLLDEGPTLRIFLLDELARLDPAAGADCAKAILASLDSPDEWAVALRSLARGDTSANARALLEQKTAQMLQYGPWQQDPSVGFLEAFDAAVYLGGTGLIPALSDLVKGQDNPAVAHAAYLALDRLVINEPAEALTALQAAPEMMQGRELTRANYFARADVRDPQQRRVLESYLLDPRLGPAELDKFAALFPNANFMISPNLLTPMLAPSQAGAMGRDAESLRVLNEWLADPRFANVRSELERAKGRLEGFVRQDSANK